MGQNNWNYNVRFSYRSEEALKAWEHLHSEEVNRNFKSQNEFVVLAINDYYERFQQKMHDPYLETREKEDAFADRIVEQVTQKVLANLPALAGVYLMQQQSMLSVGMQGMTVPNRNGVYQTDSSAQIPPAQPQNIFADEPEENDLLDFNL